MLRVGYVSDIHVEFGGTRQPNEHWTEGGDVLIVAGDFLPARLARDLSDQFISTKRFNSQRENVDRYINEVFSQYDEVLIIAGNHEHYGSAFQDTFGELRKFYADNAPNVRFLDNETHVRDNVVFIGTSLWSDFMKNNPLSTQAAESMMNDYGLIYNATTGLPITPYFTLREHRIARQYIESEYKKRSNAGNKIVVITHHAPSSQSLNTAHSGNMLDGAYYTDLSGLILDSPEIAYWVSGHTHMLSDYMIGNTRCLSNPLGYYSEQCFADYQGIRHFDL